jgi:hypothetical protein
MRQAKTKVQMKDSMRCGLFLPAVCWLFGQPSTVQRSHTRSQIQFASVTALIAGLSSWDRTACTLGRGSCRERRWSSRATGWMDGL